MMSEEEIDAIPWDDVSQERLVRLCRDWNDEDELFRRIMKRALQLVYVDVQELADEIGEEVESVELWLEGEELPQTEWMLLILTDLIQVRLQTIRRRKLPEA